MPVPLIATEEPGAPASGTVKALAVSLKPEDWPTRPVLSVAVKVFAPVVNMDTSATGTVPVNRNVPSGFTVISPALRAVPPVMIRARAAMLPPPAATTNALPAILTASPGDAPLGVTSKALEMTSKMNVAVLAVPPPTSVMVTTWEPVAVAAGTTNLYGARVSVLPEVTLTLITKAPATKLAAAKVPTVVVLSATLVAAGLLKSTRSTVTVDPAEADATLGVAPAF